MITFEDILEIEKECFQPPFRMPEKTIKYWCSKRANGDLLTFGYIGYAYVLFSQHGIARIISIAVRPAYQNCGNGMCMLFKIDEMALDRNIKRIRLEVYYKNYPAVCLYLKMKYKIIKLKLNYYAPGKHAFQMEKTL